MEKNEIMSEVLNDLIEINNDRVKGYETAAKETRAEDADLRSLFISMASESRLYVQELKKQVQQTGKEPAKKNTLGGKIYRTWMDLKVAIGGATRKAILASCEFGEDAAQKAYKTALETIELSGALRQLIRQQKSKLRESHDKIKSMRDEQTA